jgi:hypothetical protein
MALSIGSVPPNVSHRLCKDTDMENSKHIFPGKELRGHSPNSNIRVSLCDLYIPAIGAYSAAGKIGGPIVGIYKSLTDT